MEVQPHLTDSQFAGVREREREKERERPVQQFNRGAQEKYSLARAKTRLGCIILIPFDQLGAGRFRALK